MALQVYHDRGILLLDLAEAVTGETFSVKDLYDQMLFLFESAQHSILIDCHDISLRDPLQTQVVLAILSAMPSLDDDLMLAVLKPKSLEVNPENTLPHRHVVDLPLAAALGGFLPAFHSIAQAQVAMSGPRDDNAQVIRKKDRT